MAGTVRRSDGAPADGALVAVVPEMGRRAGAVAVADRRGRFQAEVPAGRYAITATADGSTAAYHEPTAIASGGQLAVELRLAPRADGFELTGIVLDHDERPLAGALIECIRYSNVQGDIFHARTDAEGRYRVLEWLRGHAIPLLSVHAGHGFTDMKSLEELVGRARIVGLGETTHGSREIFRAKHRMLEYLVSELGFTVFAIEAGLPESEAVNDYVMMGRGDPEAALAGLLVWPWDTEEVLDLVRWMRAWNADPRHQRKLRFYGFDMQFTARGVATVLGFLDKVDTSFAAE